MKRSIGVMCLAGMLLFASGARAQQGPPSGAGGGEEGGPPRADRATTPEPKAYDKVITKEAKSDEGVFTVHRLKDKVYYEIPAKEFGKDFLWVTQIARTTLGAGYGGQAAGQRVVRWERRDNRVLLRTVSYDVVADRSQPIAKAVDAANFNPIVMAFNVEAFNKDKNDAVVIDVTRLFTTEVPELSVRSRLRARGFDGARAFVERVSSFPDNINVEAIHTYTVPPDAAPTMGGAPPPTPPIPGMPAAAPRPGSYSVLMHFSMVRLPETPMMPRLSDDRVGYFTVEQFDYSRPEHRAEERVYITRWRLEKKDPAAAVSEPVKPITYYVDPATPAKWVPYVKSGIEAWQPAFEAAGFRKAIVAAEAPKDDPEWSAEDARYSVVRWLPSTIENASGPHVSDPRTGEILESDIQMYHNIQNLQRSWYFTQVGPLDPRAAKLPLPDDLMGKLIEYVVAHEVGHTLGFQHNMKASSLYPVEKLRDAEWLRTMGHVPTLMDYSRFNYVAQPEDKIDPALLIPGIGPYDKFATAWGYKPIPGAKTPDEEKKTLDEWARQQDSSSWLRFSTANSRGSDPGELTEAVGDADAVQATTLGLKNLKRVADMLIPATTATAGESYEDLGELYGRMLGQWTLEMNHVTAIVGGLNSQEKYVGQDGVKFTVVPKARQAAAVAFLNQNAFATPTWALKPEILRRIEPNGAVDRVRTAQGRVLNSLLSSARIARMSEVENIDGLAAYAPTDMLNDVRKGIFSELDAASVKVDPYRRNLQRAYVDLASSRVNAAQASADDNRALFRGELKSVDASAQAALARAADAETRRHLQDLRGEVAKALDPARQAIPAAPVSGPGRAFGEDDAWGIGVPDSCWPDYVIRPQR